MATQITEHFSLEELAATSHKDLQEKNLEYAKQHKLIELCELLEQVREVVGGPLIVSSGVRCPELNARVGGSKNSQHMRCEAADIVPKHISVADAFGLVHQSSIMFDQLILEYAGGKHWIHISYSHSPRRETLIYDKGRYTKV